MQPLQEMGKENLALKISVLEAKCGIEPGVGVAKQIAQGVKAVDNAQGQLESLRNKKICMRLFYTEKQIRRALKKAKTVYEVRTLRRLKKLPEGKERDGLQARLKELKASVNTEEMAQTALWNIVVNNTGLKNKIGALLKEPKQKGLDHPFLVSNKFKQDSQLIMEDLENFLKKLFHEIPRPINVNRKSPEENRKKPKTKHTVNHGMESKVSTDGSETEMRFEEDIPLFVSSLADESDSDGDISVPTQELAKKKKNRMGQAARRLLNEKKYGKEAKHLQKEKGKRKENREKASEARPQLHPSWEAKKKQKSAAVQPFQGQRITFSDGD